MATAYYTDAYNKAVLPDSNVPPGTVLAQFTSFVGVTGNHGSGDTFYFFKLPKGAVLLDFQLEGPAISSGTVAVGTTADVESPDYSADGVGTISASASNIINGAACTGIWKVNLIAGYQGTTAIVQTTQNGTVRRGCKMTETTGIYATFSTAYPAANDVLFASVMYYMDYGADMLYDPG